MYGTYLVAKNVSSNERGMESTPFLYDMDGDGLSDIVTLYSTHGWWTVALNMGDGVFANETVLDRSGRCTNASWAGVARISPKEASAHMLCVLPSSRQVWALPFSLTTATTWMKWLDFLPPSDAPFLRIAMLDVNGDGLQDLLLPQTSGLRVALSNGNSFSPLVTYLSADLGAFRALSTGDVNGDGLEDVGLIDNLSKCVFLALSTSVSFRSLESWGCFPSFSASSLIFVSAAKAGSIAAYAVSYAGRGDWYIAASNGTSFLPAEHWVINHGLACDHGKCGQGEESQRTFVGTIFQQGANVPVAYWSNGYWAALPPEYFAPNLYNTWEGWWVLHKHGDGRGN